MLEFEKTYPLLRVYFNRKEDFPRVWSVDDGNPTNEMRVSNIVTQGISRYVWNGDSQHSEVKARAWVEYREARIHRIDDSEELFIENSSDY